MRYDADHKARTRARVIQEAARAIRVSGPQRVGVAEVMKRAGLTHGGFYAHFASKEDLVAQALGAMFADAAANFDRRVEGRTPREALVAYIRFYLSRSHRDARESGCPLPTLSAEAPRLEADARTRFGEGVGGLTRRLGVLLSDADLPDPEALASSVLSEMVGAVVLARATSDAAQSDAILLRTRTSLMRRLDLEPQT